MTEPTGKHWVHLRGGGPLDGATLDSPDLPEGDARVEIFDLFGGMAYYQYEETLFVEQGGNPFSDAVYVFTYKGEGEVEE